MNDSLTIDCRHCNDLRVVPHVQLGPIRCPVCTVRAKPRSPVAMEAVSRELATNERAHLSITETRRIAATITKLVAHAVLDAFKFPGLPQHLVTTDRTLQRFFAAPTGTPLPELMFDMYRESRPPPLDPKTQEAVADVLKALPRGMRKFVWDWYDSPGLSVNQMAKRRQMSRRQLERERLDVLVYLRTKFLESPHADLVSLVRVLP